MNTAIHQWYYSADNQQQSGPVSADTLVSLLHAGNLTRETLVWREGMPQWQALHSVAELIGPAVAVTAEAPAPSSAPPVADTDTAPSSAPHAQAVSPYAAPRSEVGTSGHHPVQGGTVVYAGFWKRVAAVVIDGMVTSMISWVVQIPLLILVGIGGSAAFGAADPDTMSPVQIVVFILSYGVGIAIPLFYYAWMHSSASQATLGKMAVGIKVTRLSGERITFWRAFGRYFAYILSSLTLCIGLIMAAFTARKQALHDIICDTLVVDKWAFTEHPEWQKPELGAVTIVILALSGLLLLGLIVLMVFLGAAMAGLAS